MKKRTKLLISMIIIWIVVIIPSVILAIKCIKYYIEGINVAWEGIQMVYGMDAVWEATIMYIVFYFPLFVMWIILFVVAIVKTVFNNKAKKR